MGQDQEHHYDAWLKGDFIHPNDAGHRVRARAAAAARTGRRERPGSRRLHSPRPAQPRRLCR